MKTPNPLDRLVQRGETARPHEAFLIYARMGPSRSIAKVARKLGKSRQLVERWARKFDWTSRAAAHDTRENAVAIAAEDKAKEKLALTLSAAAQQKRVQERAWTWFERLCEKADEMLQFPVGRKEIVHDRHPARPGEKEGLPRTLTKIEPVKWRFSDLAKIVNLADTLGRLASGLPSRVTGITDGSGKPFEFSPDAPVRPIIIQFTDDDDDTRRAVAEFGERPRDRAD